jgi:hypothetical protein
MALYAQVEREGCVAEGLRVRLSSPMPTSPLSEGASMAKPFDY